MALRWSLLECKHVDSHTDPPCREWIDRAQNQSIGIRVYEQDFKRNTMFVYRLTLQSPVAFKERRQIDFVWK